MKTYFKQTGPSYLVLVLVALTTALLARIGLFIMDATGQLQYDYIAASSGPLLNQICTVLTGSTLMALLFTAGLVLCIALATSMLFARHAQMGIGRPPHALVAGLGAAILSLLCMIIVLSGAFSAVQVSQMGSKTSGGPMAAVSGLLFLLAITSFIAATGQVLAACITRGGGTTAIAKRTVLATIICGAIVLLCSIATFAAFNVDGPLDMAGIALRFGIDAAVNCIILFVAARCGSERTESNVPRSQEAKTASSSDPQVARTA